MIEIDIRERENVFILTPNSPISVEHIEACREAIDNYINEYDRIPNLVFKATEFPFWKGFHAVAAHFKLVKNHHKLVKKVAVVSDSTLISVARVFVDQFTNARVRRFPANAFDDAVNWATMEEDHPGSFLPVEGLPADVIAIDARGLISTVDYRDTLVPLIEAKLKDHDKLKLLMVAGPYFDGYTAGAVWDDARLGLTHFTSFSKLALVTDHEWLRHSAKLFGPLIPAEVMVFSFDELEDAKSWIKTRSHKLRYPLNGPIAAAHPNRVSAATDAALHAQQSPAR